MFTTTIGEDLNVEVSYDYDAGQKCIMHPADEAQEGIEPSVEITEVTLIDVIVPTGDLSIDISDILSAQVIEQLEAEAFEDMEP